MSLLFSQVLSMFIVRAKEEINMVRPDWRLETWGWDEGAEKAGLAR